MALTALEIRNAKPGMLADGGGLYLYVKAGGAKSWIFRFQVNGKRREMGLGALAHLGAPEARAEASRLKALAAKKIDPLDLKQSEAEASQAAAAAEAREVELEAVTFKVAAERYIAAQEASWRNPKHRQQWENTLTTYAYPTIGSLPVRDVEAEHVVEILKAIWGTKPETASRVRMRIEAVLNSAKLMGWRTGENPAIWRGGLEAVLPRISKVKQVKHHAALPWSAAPTFMADLRARDGISARALEFCILSAARSGEVRKATWQEIDLKTGLWIIPADRMKAGREHRVPLTDAAKAVLAAMPVIEGCPYVFPGLRNRPLSDMTLSSVLKRMKVLDVTVHGFRSTFRDWAAEKTDHSPETIEMALAHTVTNKVEAAYRRGDLLAKRMALMEDWAKHLDGGRIASTHD